MSLTENGRFCYQGIRESEEQERMSGTQEDEMALQYNKVQFLFDLTVTFYRKVSEVEQCWQAFIVSKKKIISKMWKSSGEK